MFQKTFNKAITFQRGLTLDTPSQILSIRNLSIRSLTQFIPDKMLIYNKHDPKPKTA